MSARRSKSNLRKLIMANSLIYHWVTSYKDNVTDREKVLNDDMNFIKRLNYQLKKIGCSQAEDHFSGACATTDLIKRCWSFRSTSEKI